MSAALRLAAAVAALSAACTLSPLGRDACTAPTDCFNGYVCVSNHCVSNDGGGTSGGGTSGGGGHAGGGRGGSSGGSIGTSDAGPDASPPSMCPASVVTVCPPTDGGTSCEQTFCGGHFWTPSVATSLIVRYQIVDPNGMFSASYRGAIRAAATAWGRVSSGLVTFKECVSTCPPGHFISVVPDVLGNGDGISNPDDVGEQRLPMPVVGSGGRVSPHRIAHQWGHVVGLAHTYQRADRGRYVRFDPAIWCGSGLPPVCAEDPANPPSGFPRITTDTFGAFDGKSKMNGLPSEGICGMEEPDEDSSEPTLGDVSAAAELFFSVNGNWSPFRPIGRSVSPTEPIDYQLAPGVDPVGSPAIAEVDSLYAKPEIFVRGTDDRVYQTARSDPSAADWSDWRSVADSVDADPAVVFAYTAGLLPETLFLAVRSQLDGNILLRSRRAGEAEFGAPTSLGAPPSGAASAPSLASESPYSFAVVVRGGDGLIYWLHYCTDGDAPVVCATGPNVWTALAAPSLGIFVGKPSAVWLIDNGGLNVVAIRDDRVALRMSSIDSVIGDWAPAENINADLAPNDPNPGVAIASSLTPGGLAFFARDPQGLLVNDTTDSPLPSIGGLLVSPPAAVAIRHASLRTDVAAIIDDHGHPGVWWRFNDNSYKAPCNYNAPGTCAQCGLP